MDIGLAGSWYPVLAVLAIIVLTVVVYLCYRRNLKVLPDNASRHSLQELAGYVMARKK